MAISTNKAEVSIVTSGCFCRLMVDEYSWNSVLQMRYLDHHVTFLSFFCPEENEVWYISVCGDMCESHLRHQWRQTKRGWRSAEGIRGDTVEGGPEGTRKENRGSHQRSNTLWIHSYNIQMCTQRNSRLIKNTINTFDGISCNCSKYR